MLKGYNAQNGQPLRTVKVTYAADPETRYNGFEGKAMAAWAAEARGVARCASPRGGPIPAYKAASV